MASIALSAAVEAVAARDPVLAVLVSRTGVLRYPPRAADGPFGALVRTIVFQQLAGRAAQAILGRVVAAAGGELSPQRLAVTTDQDLRAAGLSAAKVAAVHDLTEKSLDGTLDLAHMSRLSDSELVMALTSVRGIGTWSAEMFLIFQLRRLDVWPVTDLGRVSDV